MKTFISKEEHKGKDRHKVLTSRGIPMKGKIFDPDYLITMQQVVGGYEYTWQRKKPLES